MKIKKFDHRGNLKRCKQFSDLYISGFVRSANQLSIEINVKMEANVSAVDNLIQTPFFELNVWNTRNA